MVSQIPDIHEDETLNDEQKNTQLTELIKKINVKLVNIDNRVNRHNVCSLTNCLKKKDGTVCVKCRYNFPMEVGNETKIDMK